MQSGHRPGKWVSVLAVVAAFMEVFLIRGWNDFLFIWAMVPYAALALCALLVQASWRASLIVFAGVLIVLGLLSVFLLAPVNRDGWNALGWALLCFFRQCLAAALVIVVSIVVWLCGK